MVGVVGQQAWSLLANRAAAGGGVVATSPLPLQEHKHIKLFHRAILLRPNDLSSVAAGGCRKASTIQNPSQPRNMNKNHSSPPPVPRGVRGVNCSALSGFAIMLHGYDYFSSEWFEKRWNRLMLPV
jgi:hypothetical protein